MRDGKGTILTIDIGNTAVKTGLYRDGVLVQSVAGVGLGVEAVETMLTFNTVDGICYCCVGSDSNGIITFLRNGKLPYLELTAETPLPIVVDYDRSTLGVDRIAAAVGVSDSEVPALIVDAGTAVTADLVAEGHFMGGNISPGLKLRFRSLNAFTSRLPLVTPDGPCPDFGHDTRTAIRSGVVNGLVSEIVATYEDARKWFENVRLIVTGGDSAFVSELLRHRGLNPETDCGAVGRGLVRIFNYNAPST